MKVELTSDEALLLFEFLWRFCETERLELVDQAEGVALWDLLAQLEKQLVEPLDPRYLTLLEEARDRLRPQAE
jgi:hypothetical protein